MDVLKPAVLSILLMLPLAAVAFLSPSTSRKEMSQSLYMIAPKTAEYLDGRHAVVTGASSGIGKALALQLANCNVRHLVLSGRNVDALQEIKDSCETILKQKGGEKSNLISNSVHVLPCDLSDLKQSEEFAKRAVELCGGVVDMLILSGGITSRSSFLETDVSVDELLMKVNFLSGSTISKVITPEMVKNKRGSIVWIGSVQGLLGTPFRTSYAASKFAVQGYCEALRAEVASSGVRVHCISPGYVNTNLSVSAVKGDGSKHGKMDETTANGADANDVAVEILDSVTTSGSKSDLLVAAGLSAKVAIFLKLLAPKLLENLLVKRYLKEMDKKKKDE